MCRGFLGTYIPKLCLHQVVLEMHMTLLPKTPFLVYNGVNLEKTKLEQICKAYPPVTMCYLLLLLFLLLSRHFSLPLSSPTAVVLYQVLYIYLNVIR